MTRSRIAVCLVLVVAVTAWLWHRGASDSQAARDAAAKHDGPAPRQVSQELRDSLAKARMRAHVDLGPRLGAGEVTLAGRVVDAITQQPVANVEVVYRSTLGESSTTTVADGSYTIRLPTGMYRAFVRDDSVLSVGRTDLVRVPGAPRADAAGVPDEGLMAVVIASADTGDVDLTVLRGGIVTGRVLDSRGTPIAGAILRARGGPLRPTLGTDIAESDTDGSFELKLPAGEYDLDATHPQFAGVSGDATLSLTAGEHTRRDIRLAPGCVISGRVVAESGGAPSHEGAIEKKWGESDFEFAPAGPIEPDGTFRWTTTEYGTITLRAWPWKSPPSASKQFECHDGARFNDVVFQIPHRAPDLEGTLVDHEGQPVAFAFIDIQPRGPGLVGQQERTDADGHWQVFNLPAGPYRILAQAENRGIAVATVSSPNPSVALSLGGTGRLEGTVARLQSGSFSLVTGTCIAADGPISLPPQKRLVTVTDGHFSVDGLPACDLSFGAVWRDHFTSQNVSIAADGAATVALDLGPQKAITVHGTVRDDAGAPVENAQVMAYPQGEQLATATTDSTGHYSMRTFANSRIEAIEGTRAGERMIGDGASGDETVDLIVHANAAPSGGDYAPDKDGNGIYDPDETTD